MSEHLYAQTLAGMVRQQLADRGVVLDDSALVERLLDPAKLADHLQMLHPDDVNTLAQIGRATVKGWQA